jgi:hypothetical protein
MLKNLLELEIDVTGQLFDVYIKPFGNKLYFDGNELKKSSSKAITKIDKLLSDQYTAPEQFFTESIPSGFYTYNSDINKIVSEQQIDDTNFVCMAPLLNYEFNNEIYKLARMNHCTSILNKLGCKYDNNNIIRQLIFKTNGKPQFKIKIKDGRKHKISTHYLKMMSSLFFCGSPIEIYNLYDDRVESTISIANQIFSTKYDKEIDINSKMPVYSYTHISDKLSKLVYIKNEYVKELIISNPMSYYFYMTLLLMLLDTTCDSYISDQNTLQNLRYYRRLIVSKPTMVPYQKFLKCQA